MRAYLVAQSAGATQMLPSLRLVATMTPRRHLALLISFHYFRRRNVREVVERYAPFSVKLLVDSGGFSAMTLGETIRLTDYCRYIQRNQEHFEDYANLDVIGDPKQSARNQDVMEREGLAPFPVFHVGSEWRYLDEILERKPGRMAFGGMVPHLGTRQAALYRWCRVAFGRVAARSPETRVHGFGVGTAVSIYGLPWYSIDASSWTAAYRYRSIDLFDAKRGRFINIDCLKDAGPAKHAGLIRAYGFDPERLRPRNYTCVEGGALAILGVFRAEQWTEGRSHAEEAASSTAAP